MPLSNWHIAHARPPPVPSINMLACFSVGLDFLTLYLLFLNFSGYLSNLSSWLAPWSGRTTVNHEKDIILLGKRVGSISFTLRVVIMMLTKRSLL